MYQLSNAELSKRHSILVFLSWLGSGIQHAWFLRGFDLKGSKVWVAAFSKWTVLICIQPSQTYGPASKLQWNSIVLDGTDMPCWPSVVALRRWGICLIDPHSLIALSMNYMNPKMIANTNQTNLKHSLIHSTVSGHVYVVHL